jgi:hypothetical protein
MAQTRWQSLSDSLAKDSQGSPPVAGSDAVRVILDGVMRQTGVPVMSD